MKLFTTKEVATANQIVTNQENNRLISLTKEVERKRKELNDIELDLKTAIKLQQDWNSKEKTKFQLEIATLTKEILDLEDRRKVALIPLETKWKEIETVSKALTEHENILKLREEEFEEKAEILQEKLSAVKEQEHYLKAKEERQILAQKGIDTQIAQTIAKSKELTLLMADELEKNRQKQAELSKQESTIEAREKAVKTLHSIILTKEKDLASREAALRDRYETLERTIKRLNL